MPELTEDQQSKLNATLASAVSQASPELTRDALTAGATPNLSIENTPLLTIAAINTIKKTDQTDNRLATLASLMRSPTVDEKKVILAKEQVIDLARTCITEKNVDAIALCDRAMQILNTPYLDTTHDAYEPKGVDINAVKEARKLLLDDLRAKL
jgi:hypothetical protein